MELQVQKDLKIISKLELSSDELIDGLEIYVGRQKGCHVVIDDHLISRKSVKLTFVNGSFILQRVSDMNDIILEDNKISDFNGHEINGNSFKLNNYNIVIEGFEPSLTKTEKEMANDQSSSEDYMVASNELISDEDDTADKLQDEGLSFSDDDDDNSDVGNVEDSDDNGDDFDSFSSQEGVGQDFESSETTSFDSEDSEGFGGVDDSFDDGEKTAVFTRFLKYKLFLNGDGIPFEVYEVLDGDDIFIGRSEENQITLNDTKVSSKHAKISRVGNQLFVEDLNSANGTILNDYRINKSAFNIEDRLIIGNVTIVLNSESAQLESEMNSLMPALKEEEVEVEEFIEEEVDLDDFNNSDEVEEKSFIKKLLKDKKRLAMYGGVLFLVILLNVDTDGEKKSSDKEKDKEEKVNTKEGNSQIDDKDNGESKDKPDAIDPLKLEKLRQNYELALAKYGVRDFNEAKIYLKIVEDIDPNYKETQTFKKRINEALEEITRLEKEKKDEKERLIRAKKVAELVEKARQAVKERQIELSKQLFSKIFELDPENIDVPQMKLEIEAYQRKIEEEKLAKEAAKKRRNKLVDALKPGKSLFLQEQWYKAIGELEKFLELKDNDEDLITEASKMIKDSKENLKKLVKPLLSKARAFKDGQDLKQAYDLYREVLEIEPTNEEALNFREEIKEDLDRKARRVYRDALIAESLSLFEEAKEKFQEVQQISPIGSEYYIKATEKLEDYLE